MERENYMYSPPVFCKERDGFAFTRMNIRPYISEEDYYYEAIIIHNPESCESFAINKGTSTRYIDEHIAYINDNKLEKAVIIADNIDFITNCPTLKYIKIYPSKNVITKTEEIRPFDYSPLYSMPEIKNLHCETNYPEMGIVEKSKTVIDYSQINGLKELRLHGTGHQNYNHVRTLEELYVYSDKTNKTIYDVSCSENLKRLWLTFSSIESLDGIEELTGIQQLCVDYCRKLTDISALSSVGDSLRCLSIDHCPKVTDFSCLKELHNMEFLDLRGKNDLPDLSFLNEMPKLKLFNFSMNVLDGDLSPCLRVPYVDSMRNRKTYNLKNSQLQKNAPEGGFEII